MTTSTTAPAGASAAGNQPPLLEARDISKYFGAVVALENVSLTVRAGEINCLLGDNGAGKSTLIKTLSGVHPPDVGTLAVDGQPVQFGSPRDALNAGIATVYQDLSVMPLMSISRNFFLGNEPTRRLRAAPPLRLGEGGPDRPGGDEEHRHRRPRHGAARRDAVRRRAPDAGDRPGGVLRGAGPDSRRADLRARRQGVGDRPPPRHLGPKTRPRRDLHHPQRPARPADRRLVHDPDARPAPVAPTSGASSTPASCTA